MRSPRAARPRTRHRRSPPATSCGAARRTAACSRGRPPRRSGPSATGCAWVSKASSRLNGGRTVTSRSASIVLPTPGGPAMRRWCPPVAASSMARRASGCPTTSARSGPDRWTAGLTSRVAAGGSGSPRSAARCTSARRRPGDASAVDDDPVDELGLRDVLQRHDDVAHTPPGRLEHRRQDAPNAADPAVEGQLAEVDDVTSGVHRRAARRQPARRPRWGGRSRHPAWGSTPARG